MSLLYTRKVIHVSLFHLFIPSSEITLEWHMLQTDLIAPAIFFFFFKYLWPCMLCLHVMLTNIQSKLPEHLFVYKLVKTIYFAASTNVSTLYTRAILVHRHYNQLLKQLEIWTKLVLISSHVAKNLLKEWQIPATQIKATIQIYITCLSTSVQQFRIITILRKVIKSYL